ncbi:MAG: hypothetical protein R6V50_04140 [Thermoplasmatota archaeon]
MNIKIFVISTILLLLLVGISGCLKEERRFLGTWETEDGATTFEFTDDETVIISGTGPFDMASLIGTFNYTLSDQKITIFSGSFGVTLDYRFPESNRLLLSNGQGASLILYKQE